VTSVGRGSWLNDPSFVDAEYASEQRLVDRNLADRSFLEGVGIVGKIPHFTGAFRMSSRQTVFVATQPRRPA
jgi:hypothetical protein